MFNQNYNLKSDTNKINNYITQFNQSLLKNKLNIVDFCFKKNPQKINVGFVSPDFRSHPVGYALTNVIKYLKSYNFNLFAYYNFTLNDVLSYIKDNKSVIDINYFRENDWKQNQL